MTTDILITASGGIVMAALAWLGGIRQGRAAVVQARAAMLHSETERSDKIIQAFERQVDNLQKMVESQGDRIRELEKDKFEAQKDWKTVAIELIEASRYNSELRERLRKFE